MNKRYPRLRWALPNGRLGLREGVILSFFMRHPHSEIAQAVEHTLEIYLDTVGREKLGWTLEDMSDIDPDEYKGWSPDMVPLDEKCWTRVRGFFQPSGGCTLELEELPHEAGGFRFEYHGEAQDDMHHSDSISQVSFWLPTEYLENQGPGRVKTLAMEIARVLPFNSGYVSLGFNTLGIIDPVRAFIQENALRYPGMDLPFLDASLSLGTRIRGSYWLNFYSQPVLSELGGLEGLKARLAIPGVSVEELSPQKVLVALGEWPDMGDTQQPDGMQPYRALARVLEPHLQQEEPFARGPSREWLQRWRRRFLD